MRAACRRATARAARRKPRRQPPRRARAERRDRVLRARDDRTGASTGSGAAVPPAENAGAHERVGRRPRARRRRRCAAPCRPGRPAAARRRSGCSRTRTRCPSATSPARRRQTGCARRCAGAAPGASAQISPGFGARAVAREDDLAGRAAGPDAGSRPPPLRRRAPSRAAALRGGAPLPQRDEPRRDDPDPLRRRAVLQLPQASVASAAMRLIVASEALSVAWPRRP